MRHKKVALRESTKTQRSPGLELLRSIDDELYSILAGIFQEKTLRFFNSRLLGVEEKQKQLLKLYELVLKNAYCIKGDQTKAHIILSKIEDLLSKEGIHIISAATDGITTIYYLDTNSNSFYLISPPIDEDITSEIFLKSLGQVIDRYIVRTFGVLGQEQHNYIKNCLELIIKNLFDSGVLKWKVIIGGWHHLIHAFRHLNDITLGDKSLWDHIRRLQENNILFIPFFEIDFDSEKGRDDLSKTMEAILLGVSSIPIEILKKDSQIPLLVSPVIPSAGSVIGERINIIVINHKDVDPNEFKNNPELMFFKTAQIIAHEIVGHYLFYALLKLGKINESHLRALLAAAKIISVTYNYNGRRKEAGIEEWFRDFNKDLYKMVRSLVNFDCHSDPEKYLSSFHERIAFAVGDPGRDIRLRYEHTDIEIRDELALQRDIVRVLTAIGLLTFERDGRRFAWHPFDLSVTVFP